MTDDKEEKTLEGHEHFVEVAKSRDVEVLHLFNFPLIAQSHTLCFLVGLRGQVKLCRVRRQFGASDDTVVRKRPASSPILCLPGEPAACDGPGKGPP